MRVSEISLGTWAFGSEWGAVDDETSLATMRRALDLGVNFLDTADVYGLPLVGSRRIPRGCVKPFQDCASRLLSCVRRAENRLSKSLPLLVVPIRHARPA
jgi:aryl-alcohol dehydrogenase-like predicted oxidoreductase